MDSILDKRVQVGMVYTGGSVGNEEYVVWRIDNNVVVSKYLHPRRPNEGMSHASWYGWFAEGEFQFIRQMSQREFKEYNL